MKKENKYSYKGKAYTEKVLREAYPDTFDQYVKQGVLNIVEPKEVKQVPETKVEEMYVYKNKAYKESVLRKSYPDTFDKYVEQGVLKKKDKPQQNQPKENLESPSTTVQGGSSLGFLDKTFSPQYFGIETQEVTDETTIPSPVLKNEEIKLAVQDGFVQNVSDLSDFSKQSTDAVLDSESFAKLSQTNKNAQVLKKEIDSSVNFSSSINELNKKSEKKIGEYNSLSEKIEKLGEEINSFPKEPKSQKEVDAINIKVNNYNSLLKEASVLEKDINAFSKKGKSLEAFNEKTNVKINNYNALLEEGKIYEGEIENISREVYAQNQPLLTDLAGRLSMMYPDEEFLIEEDGLMKPTKNLARRSTEEIKKLIKQSEYQTSEITGSSIVDAPLAKFNDMFYGTVKLPFAIASVLSGSSPMDSESSKVPITAQNFSIQIPSRTLDMLLSSNAKGNEVYKFFDDLQNESKKINSDARLKNLSQEQIDKGIFENIADGDYTSAAKNLGFDVLNTIPQVAVAAFSPNVMVNNAGRLGISAATEANIVAGATLNPFKQGLNLGIVSMAQGKGEQSYNQSIEEGFTPAQATAISTFKTAATLVSESLFTKDLQALRGTTQGRKLADDIIKNKKEVIKSFRSSIPKEALEGGGEEGFEELFEGLIDGAVDYVSKGELINPYKLADGVVVGMASGGGSSTFGQVKSLVSVIRTDATILKAQKGLQEIDNLIDKGELSPSEIAVLEGEKTKIKEGIGQYSTKENKKINELSDEAKEEYILSSQKIAEKLDTAKEMPEGLAKDILKEEIEKSITERDDLLDKKPIDAVPVTEQTNEEVVNEAPSKAEEVSEESNTIVEDDVVKEKKIASPSVNKILGKPKKPTKSYTNTQITRLAEQIDKSGIKEGVKRARVKSEEVIRVVKEFISSVPKGEMTSAQSSVLTKRASEIRTPSQVDTFLDYADKVFNDAEYALKIKSADSIKQKVKSKSKAKTGVPSNITAMARDFLVIDPAKVPDIDQYLLYAERVLSLGRKPKVGKDGVKDMSMYVSENEIRTEYLNRYNALNDADIKKSMLADFEYLTDAGVLDASMSSKEIAEIVDAVYKEESEDFKDSKKSKAKTKSLKKIVDYKIMELEDISTQGLSEKALEQLNYIEKLDLDKVDLSDSKLAELYSYLENYIYNGKLNNLSSITAYIAAKESAKETISKVDKLGVKVKNWVLKSGKAPLKFMSITQFLEFIKGSQKAGSSVYSGSFLYEYAENKTKAENILSKKIEQFQAKFKNKDLDIVKSADNRVDRAMYGFLSQVPTDNFNEALDWLESSIAYYESGQAGIGTKDLGEAARKVFNNKYKGSKTIENVKLSNTNSNIINWFRDSFNEIKEEYFENAEIVHNRTLEESENYLPFITKSKADGERSKEDDSLDRPQSLLDKVIVPNRSGSTNRRTNTYSPNRVLNLDFENAMFNTYKNQVMDIETSFSIKKIAAFFRLPESVDLLGGNNTKRRLFERTKEYVNDFYKNNDLSEIESFTKGVFNYAANLSGRVALGGVDQAFKQSLPVAVNAGINAGFNNVMDGFKAMSNGFGEKLIKDSPVSRRSFIDQDTKRIMGKIPSAEKKALKDKLINTFKVIDAQAEFLMMYVIQNSDKKIAQATWLAYYKKNRGNEFKGWESEAKSPDKDSKAHADLMVSNTQNVNDLDQQASFIKGKSGTIESLTRKILLPFISFRINQISDEMIQFSKLGGGNSTEALVRLGGRISEQVAFLTIRKALLIGSSTAAAALLKSLTGLEEDEEDKQKFTNESWYGIAAESLLALTPFYGMSEFFDNKINTGLNKMYYYGVMTEEEREKYTGRIYAATSEEKANKKIEKGFEKFSKSKAPLFVNDDKGVDFGALSIGAVNYFNDMTDLYSAVYSEKSGEEYIYTTRSGKDIAMDLSEEEKEALVVFSVLENLDLYLPNDIAKVGKRAKSKLFRKQFKEMYGD